MKYSFVTSVDKQAKNAGEITIRSASSIERNTSLIITSDTHTNTAPIIIIRIILTTAATIASKMGPITLTSDFFKDISGKILRLTSTVGWHV